MTEGLEPDATMLIIPRLPGRKTIMKHIESVIDMKFPRQLMREWIPITEAKPEDIDVTRTYFLLYERGDIVDRRGGTIFYALNRSIESLRGVTHISLIQEREQ